MLLMLANSYMVDGFSLIGGVGNRRLPIFAAESKSAPLRGSVFPASSPALPLRARQGQRNSARTVLAMTQDGGKPPGSEPLDGGVADAFRHLTIILRGAEKRKCGILMRRHS